MDVSRTELTLRGIVLGVLLTVVFTAANVYLGLKIGLTFASSIPAAVISMAALRALGGGSLLENNIVQTVASAAGTLASVIFVVPSLVMVGHWHGIPYFQTAGLCVAGSVLGVLFTIPLRRALVVESGLTFPEGVAAAKVLRVGQEGGDSGGARALAGAGIVSAVVSFATGGLGLLADGFGMTGVAGGAVFRFATGFSLALLGAGYLMGVAAGASVLLGLVVAWGVAVPVLTALSPGAVHGSALGLQVWTHQVRFIGAGVIGVAAVATLVGLAPAIGRGIGASFRAARRRGGPAAERTERDLGGKAIGWLGGGALLLLWVCFYGFAPEHPGLGLFGAVFAAGFGFVVAAACGYMSGIVGSSASPISGIAVVAVVTVSLVLLVLPGTQAGTGGIGVPLALFATSAVIAIATISNDNLQDLKTGYLLGATPGWQQLALIIGGVAGAAVIPPILELLYQAYGFTGAMPRPGMDPAAALAAPQAALMAALAQGIMGHSLDWTMIGIGIGLGAVVVAVDMVLRRRTRRLSLPALGTGIGIYLPASISVTLVIGAVIAFAAGWRLRRRSEAVRAASAGHATLVASGLIVGESLVGVLIAGVIAGTGRQDALAVVGGGFGGVATLLGMAVFVLLVAGFYRVAATARTA